VCKGRLTWEHAWIYAGRQINEAWAIVPCCMSMNVGVSGDDKKFNQYVALIRAKSLGIDLSSDFPKRNWEIEFDVLHEKFYKIFL
jgi:hypothetical protein